MKYISLFSGIEAASCAWQPLGWEAVAFSEIDPFCCEVLATHYPNILNLGDIKKIDWSGVGTVDIVVGGSPCQAFSVAGKREGLMDERGCLMYEYVRAVRDIRPTWCLWENVPGVLSQDRGYAFASLIWELEKLGYSLCWRILDAQYFGVAQRRRRVFLIGHSRVGCAAAVLFERESLQRNTQKNPRERAKNTRNAGKGTESAGFLTTSVLGFGDEHSPTLDTGKHSAVCIAGDTSHRGNGMGVQKDLSYTLNTMDRHAVCLSGEQEHSMLSNEVSGSLRSGHDRFSVCNGSYVRKLTPIECERLQGFPDNWTAVQYKGKPAPDTQRYKALGNSMTVPVMAWLGKRIEVVDK